MLSTTYNEPLPETSIDDKSAISAMNNIILNDGPSVEKITRMQAYAMNLRRKNPQMKPERLKRKVAEYFKIKLIPTK